MQNTLLGLGAQAQQGLDSNLAAMQQYYAGASSEVKQALKASEYLKQAISGVRAEIENLTDQILKSSAASKIRIGELTEKLGVIIFL